MAFKRGETEKRKFVFEPPTLESVRQRATQSGSKYEMPFKSNVDIFRAQDGNNIIRILPQTWGDPQNHYSYKIWIHKNVGHNDYGAYLCPRMMYNKKCPVCEASERSAAAGDKDDAYKLKAFAQYVCWIIDRADKDMIPRILTMSGKNDSSLSSQSDHYKLGLLVIAHPDVGYDVIMKKTGQKLDTTYQYIIDREPSPISDDPRKQDEILDFITENPVPSTLKCYDYEFLKAKLTGGLEEPDQTLDDEPQEEEPVRKPVSRARVRVDDDEDVRPRHLKHASNGSEDEDEVTASSDDDDDDDLVAAPDDDDDDDGRKPVRVTRPATRSPRQGRR